MAVSTLTPADEAVLKSTLVCAPMSDETLAPILETAVVTEHKRHDVIFRAGDPSDKLYIVLDGWVRLSTMQEGRAQTMIAAFSKGDSFAEAAAFALKSYPATAQAMCRARVVALEGSKILDCMVGDREVLSAGISSIFRRLHYLVSEVESLKSKTIRQRVVQFLLKTANRPKGEVTLRLPYDKSLIAAKIGTSPENLSRTFAELREFGVTLNGRDAKIECLETLSGLLRR